MIAYLDASALVKLYVDERGSAEVRGCCAEARVLATSPVAFVEGSSAISRRRREGSLIDDDARLALDRLRADRPAYARITLDEQLAAEIADRRQLRSLDAIHLAAAITVVRANDDLDVVVLTFDERQASAASAEGLQVGT